MGFLSQKVARGCCSYADIDMSVTEKIVKYFSRINYFLLIKIEKKKVEQK